MKRDAVTHIMSTYRDSHSLNMMMMRMPRNSSYHVSPNRLHTVGSHSLPLRCIPFAYDLQPRALHRTSWRRRSQCYGLQMMRIQAASDGSCYHRVYGSEFTRAGVMECETARTRCCGPALITIPLYGGPTRSSANSYGAGGAGPRKRILRVT